MEEGLYDQLVKLNKDKRSLQTVAGSKQMFVLIGYLSKMEKLKIVCQRCQQKSEQFGVIQCGVLGVKTRMAN